MTPARGVNEATSTAVDHAHAPPEPSAPITVTEGGAVLHFRSRKEVFYNYVQCTNRDLSMIMTKVFADIRALEAAEKAARRKGAAKAPGGELQSPAAPAAAPAAASAEPRLAPFSAGAEKAADLVSSFGVGAAGARDDAGGDGMDGGDATDDLMADGAIVEERHGGGAHPLRVLDALSASGLRALRYVNEVPEVGYVLANDLSQAAVDSIRVNAQRNGPRAHALIEPRLGDASLACYVHRAPVSARFDVVDLDPYGTAAPFLDGAVQAVAEGGLLAVTCTDMGVLCGNHGEACFAKYGAYPLRGKHCHEMALRLLLGSIDAHAARYKRFIAPLVCVSVDFYVRVFVRVFSSASVVKRAASKRALLYQCQGCEAFHLQRTGKVSVKGASAKFAPASAPPLEQACEHCGRHYHVGGPLWAEPIHDAHAVRRALAHLAAGVPADTPAPLAPPPPPPPTAAAAAAAVAANAAAAAAVVAADAVAGSGGAAAHSISAGAPSLAALARLPPPAPAAVAWAHHRKLLGLLTAVSEELLDAPLYVDLGGLCGTLRCRTPPLSRFLNALLARGHRVSRTHASATGVKTDAPWSELWDVLRCWVAQNPVKGGASDSSPAAAILARAPRFVADFAVSEAAKAAGSLHRHDGVKRFSPNPAADWGPGVRNQAHLKRDEAEPADGAEGETADAALGADALGGYGDQRAAKRARNQNRHTKPRDAAAQQQQHLARRDGGGGGDQAAQEAAHDGGSAEARAPPQELLQQHAAAPAGVGPTPAPTADGAAPADDAQRARGAAGGPHGGGGSVDGAATRSQSGPGH